MVPGAWLLLVGASAQAARPAADGRAWSFDTTDVLDHVDSAEGRVRVHFSVEGPSVTVMTDADGSGAPDLPERVAERAEAALDLYGALGFRAPLSEADLGLGELGGSGALDVYMIDFALSADGRFETDRCEGGLCAGFLLIENDFAGYGYSDLDVAVDVLTSHELFHGVQYAYTGRLPDWMSEGTATWAERRFDPDSRDFIGFCNAYLDDPGRSLDRPPTGVGSAWIYGTALFFEMMTERLGEGSGVALLEAMEGRGDDEGVDAIIDVLEAGGDTLADTWTTFATWNLATGRRNGATTEGWAFAAQLGAPPLEVEAEDGLLDDDNRFYPLAATYYRLEHPGGPLALAFADDPTGLIFGLHPVQSGADDGPVLDALVQLAPQSAGTLDLGDQPAGGYLLMGTFPEPAAESVKVHLCLGDPDAVAAACAVDAGGGDTGADGGDEGEDSGAPIASDEEAKTGCGCASSGSSSTAGLLALLPLLALSRRRARAGAASGPPSR